VVLWLVANPRTVATYLKKVTPLVLRHVVVVAVPPLDEQSVRHFSPRAPGSERREDLLVGHANLDPLDAVKSVPEDAAIPECDSPR
jgi:hypothetical protein